MTELQKTNALLRELLRLIFVQHQDLIWALSPDAAGTWLRRFAHAYRMQKRFGLFTEEEMKLIRKHDLVDCFLKIPGLMDAWPHLRKYYPNDERKFMEEVIANARKVQKIRKVQKDKKNDKCKKKK